MKRKNKHLSNVHFSNKLQKMPRFKIYTQVADTKQIAMISGDTMMSCLKTNSEWK